MGFINPIPGMKFLQLQERFADPVTTVSPS